MQRLLVAGEKEFLEKGFKSASLRRIVKSAGVTTGAFYGYFYSKEELFECLIKEPVEFLFQKFNHVQEDFKKQSPSQQEQDMGQTSAAWQLYFVEYIYQHFTAFKLLVCCAEGTKYEKFISKLVSVEVQATRDFMAVQKDRGKEVRHIDPQLEQILIRHMFTAFFEIVVHDLSKERAIEYVIELQEFHIAGWKAIMGI